MHATKETPYLHSGYLIGKWVEFKAINSYFTILKDFVVTIVFYDL